MQTDHFLAEILWDYNQLGHNLEPSDFIFIMCSYNLLVADHAYDLWQKNMGKFIAVSGGIAHQGDFLETPWDEPEAIIFKKRLRELGVPEDKIITEEKATNCGENIEYTKPLISRDVNTGIVVQKPYMERRAYASVSKQWPEVKWRASSPAISFSDYCDQFCEDKTINIMVGDTYRLKAYAEKGFLTPQSMPETVEESLRMLIDRGYTKHINV